MTEEKKKPFFVNKHGTVYGETVSTPIGRIVYPSIVAPNTKFAQPGQLGTYGFELLIPKRESPGFSPKILEYNKSMLRQYKAGAERTIAAHAKAKLFNPLGALRDGDKMLDDEGNPKKLYAGYYVLRCTARLNSQEDLEKKRIKTVKIGFAGKSEPVDAGVVAGGMLVRVFGQLLASTPPTGPVCSLQPHVVQIIGDDGVRLGGGRVDPVAALDTQTVPDSLLEELLATPGVEGSASGDAAGIEDDDDDLVAF